MSLRTFSSDFLSTLGDRLRAIPDDDLACEAAPPPPIDFAPLAAAARSIGDWLLATARSRTHDPDDLAAIDRIERARCAQAAGARGVVAEQDLLVVIGILIEAFELDVGLSGLGALAGSLYDATDGPAGDVADRIVAQVVRAVSRPAGGPAPTPVRVPVVIRRGPRIAHGVEDAGGAPHGSILIIR